MSTWLRVFKEEKNPYHDEYEGHISGIQSYDPNPDMNSDERLTFDFYDWSTISHNPAQETDILRNWNKWRFRTGTDNLEALDSQYWTIPPEEI